MFLSYAGGFAETVIELADFDRPRFFRGCIGE